MRDFERAEDKRLAAALQRLDPDALAPAPPPSSQWRAAAAGVVIAIVALSVGTWGVAQTRHGTRTPAVAPVLSNTPSPTASSVVPLPTSPTPTPSTQSFEPPPAAASLPSSPAANANTSVPPAPSRPAPSDSTAPEAYFQSPTGNIRCTLAADGAGGFNLARCDITQWQWQLPPKPTDCIFDWGGVVAVMPTGVGAVVCHSDGVPSGQVLAYGKSVRRGPFSCTSELTGVTCKNDDTGHGFTLSRESFRGF